MELRELVSFVAVADHGQFAAAADELGLAVSTVSQHVHRLEHELGVPLFERAPRGALLTPEGSALLGTARRCLEESGRIVQIVERAKSAGEGELRLVYNEGAGETVTRLVRAFRRHRPGTDVALRCTRIGAVQGVEAGQFSAGVVWGRHGSDGPLGVLQLGRHRFDRLVVSKDHPLARRAAVTLADLRGQTLLFFDRQIHPQLYDKLSSYLEARNLGVRLRAGTTTEQWFDEADLGQGLLLLPRTIADRYARPNVVAVPVRGGVPQSDLQLVWRRDDPSVLLAAFVEAARR